MAPVSAVSESGDQETFVRDCARAPEIAAFDPIDDGQLVEAIRTDRENVFPLIAFYYRHEAFVRGLLAFEGEMPVPARRLWFAAFDALLDDRSNVLPVAQWLVPLAARICLERQANLGIGTALPAPLVWHLHRAFERIPDPLRIVAVLSEVAGEKEVQIADFFSRRHLLSVAAEIRQLRAEARFIHTFSLPLAVRQLYFTDPFAVHTAALLLPQVGISVSAEIQRFDRWQKIPSPPPEDSPSKPAPDNQVVPEEQTLPVTITPPIARPTVGSLKLERPARGIFLGLGVACAVFGLGVVVYQMAWPRASEPGEIHPPQTAPAPKPVREPSTPVTASGDPSSALPGNSNVLPFVDGVPVASPPHFVVVLIADPQGTNLARVRRLQPKAYYRTLGGTAWIQYGAYNTVEKAAYGLVQARAAGLTAILAGS